MIVLARIDGGGPIGRPGVGEAQFGGIGRRFAGDLDARLGLLALEQRVLFQLGLDIFVELLVRQLQQLDRLLQLGRDDQPLPLPNLEPLTDHLSRLPGAVVARNLLSG